jgi:adenosylcobinamide-GDP ribazoletransferase
MNRESRWAGPLKRFLLALQFFTRIPVTGRVAGWAGYSPEMLRASAAHFPAVGWIVGGLSALVLAGVIAALPDRPASLWVAALASTVFSVLLTGGFHEDGLADTADGLGGSLDRERALEIMKDSRIGTYGALALVLAVTGKLGLLVLLGQVELRWMWAGLFAAHVTSRFLPLLVIRTMIHVGDAGRSKSKPLADRIGNAAVVVGAAWWMAAMALACWLLPGRAVATGIAGSFAVAALVAWRLQRRLRGFTGDGLGATQQIAECGFYFGMAVAAGSS